MDESIYTNIMIGIENLLNIELNYITNRNSVKITGIDQAAHRINVIRGEEEININFDRFRSVANHLSKGALVDINDALGAGGNDRSAIETIIAHLPHVGYYKGNTQYNTSPQKKIAWFQDEIHQIGQMLDTSNIIHIPLKSSINKSFSLPKPFLLLAGISGTGKTRFVREQAAVHNKGDSNYCLIPVRPDWHEPSDLLGYISRIGAQGPRYNVTELLLFVVQAWLDAVELDSVTDDDLVCKDPSQMIPHWLCLDEMNLAPVEQYFADYLSVVETREWKDHRYSCHALLKAVVLEKQLDKDGQSALRTELKLEGAEFDILWSNFLKKGISLPPNLIVAGTVNMDETTHGFSRKVIDRAFTIDFGVFYPNDYEHYFESPIRPKTLSFPLLSQVSKADLEYVKADAEGLNSIKFLTAINTVLKGTPFELAYRALNELLLAVVSFAPNDDLELQAVWDDFLMSKVLPRIDGDTEKLSNSVDDNSSDILSALLDVIGISFKDILINQRLDLLRENKDKNPLMISCRSKQKLEWMKARLTLNGFTTFWP